MYGGLLHFLCTVSENGGGQTKPGHVSETHAQTPSITCLLKGCFAKLVHAAQFVIAVRRLA